MVNEENALLRLRYARRIILFALLILSQGVYFVKKKKDVKKNFLNTTKIYVYKMKKKSIFSGVLGTLEKNIKKFQKSVDKQKKLCYNNTRRKRKANMEA